MLFIVAMTATALTEMRRLRVVGVNDGEEETKQEGTKQKSRTKQRKICDFYWSLPTDSIVEAMNMVSNLFRQK